MRAALLLLSGLGAGLGAIPAWASASLLVEEPFGHFGGMNPTGHAAVYLDHVCAESLTRLRPCEPGEMGVVVSRYHRVGGYDWLAIPMMPYLYAVERPEDVPEIATEEIEAQLREAYRRKRLLSVAPDAKDGGAPNGEWIQLIGSAYDRTIRGFTVPTTAAQDLSLIHEFNDRRHNVSHFNLFFNNCADLARVILNHYYPHMTHRSFVADAGFTTPKQLARTMTHFDRKHPEVEMTAFVIPQVPGTIERSTRVRGVAESLLTSKRYVVPLLYFHPEFTGGLAVAYFSRGRFALPRDTPVTTVAQFAEPERPETEQSGPVADTATRYERMDDKPQH